MTDRAAGTLARLLARWVGVVGRRARTVLVVALAVSALSVVAVVEWLGINTDTTDMLAPDLPFRANSRAMNAAFPQLSDSLLIVIDGDTPDQADDGARALAQSLRREPALFPYVYDPQGDPFFRRNGLLFLDLDALDRLADRLAEAQPFLGSLWKDPSLRGLADVLILAIDESAKGDRPPIDIAPVLDAMAEVAEAQARGRYTVLSWRTLMTGDAATDSPYRRFLVTQPVLDFASLSPAGNAMVAVRRTADSLGLTAGRGVRVRLTGSAALAAEELRSVEEGLGLAGALSLTLVIGLLAIGLRGVRIVAAVLVALVIGLVWTAGFAALAVGDLNLISVAFAVLFIGLSVDFGIHFALRYRESIDRGVANHDALGEAATGVGGALVLCAVAAAIGFLAFLPTDYVGLAELGLIAGGGMGIALVTNLTVVPAMLSLLPPTPRPVDAEPRAASTFLPWIGAHGRGVAAISLAMCLGATILAVDTDFDFDPLNLKDPRTESVATLLDLMADESRGTYGLTAMTKNLSEARRVAGRLGSLEPVKRAVSVADYVPKDQADKLAVIEDMAYFLAPALATTDIARPPGPDERVAALGRLRDALTRMAEDKGSGAAGEAARRLGRALDALKGTGAAEADRLMTLEQRLLRTLPQRLEDLRQSLDAGPVTLEDLPPDLRARQVAADGRTKVEIAPRENLHRNRAGQRRFVEAVQRVAPTATGTPVTILAAGDAVVTAFREAALFALSAIAVLLAVVTRSFRGTVLVFAPLLAAALLTLASAATFGLSFNFANVIVLPLLFGLGVANGIHLVFREREASHGSDALATSTPRAVVFSALTTIGSFGSIALSSHPGTASMGILLTIAITLTLLCTLTVLPALMSLWPRPASPFQSSR